MAKMAAETRKSDFRPDLEGLRGLAVILVVAHHLHTLECGFVGVDVFFVLSGYLIADGLLSSFLSDEKTQIMVDGAGVSEYYLNDSPAAPPENNPSAQDSTERRGARTTTAPGWVLCVFFRDLARSRIGLVQSIFLRRCRRILPALSLAVVVTAALTLLGTVSKRWARISDVTVDAGLAGFFGIADKHFARTLGAGYFDVASSTLPLLHLWSLSLEMRFYFAFPLLFLVVDALVQVLVWFWRRFSTTLLATRGTLGCEMSVQYSGTLQSRRTTVEDCSCFVERHMFICRTILVLGMVSVFGVWDAHRFFSDGDWGAYYIHRGWAIVVGCSIALWKGLVVPKSRRGNHAARKTSISKVVLLAKDMLGVFLILSPAIFGRRTQFRRLSPIAVLGASIIIAFPPPSPFRLTSTDGGRKAMVDRPSFLTSSSLRFVGRISYSLYLWHWPIIALLTDQSLDVLAPQVFVITLLSIFLVSYTSYRFFEPAGAPQTTSWSLSRILLLFWALPIFCLILLRGWVTHPEMLCSRSGSLVAAACYHYSNRVLQRFVRGPATSVEEVLVHDGPLRLYDGGVHGQNKPFDSVNRQDTGNVLSVHGVIDPTCFSSVWLPHPQLCCIGKMVHRGKEDYVVPPPRYDVLLVGDSHAYSYAGMCW